MASIVRYCFETPDAESTIEAASSDDGIGSSEAPGLYHASTA